jgi:hypothetical protein
MMTSYNPIRRHCRAWHGDADVVRRSMQRVWGMHVASRCSKVSSARYRPRRTADDARGERLGAGGAPDRALGVGETKRLMDATFEETKARLYANVIQLESALAAVQIELASTVAQLGQTNEKLIALTQAHDALQVDHERASTIDPYDDDIRPYDSTSRGMVRQTWCDDRRPCRMRVAASPHRLLLMRVPQRHVASTPAASTRRFIRCTRAAAVGVGYYLLYDVRRSLSGW